MMNDTRPTIVVVGLLRESKFWLEDQAFLGPGYVRVLYATEDIHLEGFANQTIILLPSWNKVVTVDTLVRIAHSNNLIIKV